MTDPIHHNLPVTDLTPGKQDGWIWVQSDLQLAQPEIAQQVLGDAVADIREMGIEIDGIWCLGDAICGRREADLNTVAETSIDLLESFGVPIVYVLGNHEMDLRAHGVARWPLYERVVGRPLWHVQAQLEDYAFERKCFGMRIVFMGDHAEPAPAARWYTQHHHIKDEGYPYDEAQWERLRQHIAASPEPVLTVSHYAYPGGQRPGGLMERLLPLPATVVTHFHGHAHIGDLVWNAEHPYRRENPIDGDARVQYNISALETERSAGSHSALLKFTGGRLTEIRIRCHEQRAWLDTFPVA